ncbi:hypothetical protein [Palleronia pelagia]|uniref:Uncharacterized protein n=1 Tax=Palleronia pelagia TaxID=387096 RepID=A0A1H8KV59_9RHOB|nr:hypothetical protein [Palleronia pelagia]SEN96739.1 hypothetical protein SAMN04488011_108163 [Palleronia pelagia]
MTILGALVPLSAVGDVASAMARAQQRDFDASMVVRCAQNPGETLVPCEASVARVPPTAAVVVRFPSGFARMLTFSAGEFLRGNATMSGVGRDTDWRLDGGTYHVRVDDQRFEIPETLVTGD